MCNKKTNISANDDYKRTGENRRDGFQRRYDGKKYDEKKVGNSARRKNDSAQNNQQRNKPQSDRRNQGDRRPESVKRSKGEKKMQTTDNDQRVNTAAVENDIASPVSKNETRQAAEFKPNGAETKSAKKTSTAERATVNKVLVGEKSSAVPEKADASVQTAVKIELTAAMSAVSAKTISSGTAMTVVKTAVPEKKSTVSQTAKSVTKVTATETAASEVKVETPETRGTTADTMKSTTSDTSESKENKTTPGTAVSTAEEQKTDTTEEKKIRRPSVIELKDKSDLFKQVIDVALTCEKITDDNKRLRTRNKELTEEKKKLQDEMTALGELLREGQKVCKEKEAEILKLQQDVAHRDEVVDIIKADKSESAQEFKNALAAALRTFYVDYCELKEVSTLDEVGLAFVDTLDGIFKTLSKNGIDIQK